MSDFLKSSLFLSTRITQYLYILGVLFVVFLFVFFNSEDNPLLNQFQIDSEVYKYCGRTILDGGKPYLDYFDHKGPLIHFINALALKLSNKWGILIFDFLLLGGVLLLSLFSSTRRTGVLIFCLFFILISQSYEGGNFTEIIGLPLVLISFLIISNKLRNGAFKLPILLVYLSVSLLIFNKITYAVPILSFFFIELMFSPNKTSFFNFLKGACFLGIVFLFFCFIYVFGFGFNSFQAFLEASIFFNFRYASENSGFTYLNLFFDSFVGLAYRPHYWFFVFFFICKLILIFNKRENKENQRMILFWLFFDLFTLFTVTLGKRGYGHYDLMILPSLLSLLIFWNSLNVSKLFRKTFIFIFGILLLFSIQRINKSLMQTYWRWGASIHNIPEFISEKALKPSNQFNWATKLKAEVRQMPAITVCKNMCKIYNILNKKSSSRYFYPVTKLNGELLLPDYYKEVGENLVLDEVLILETGNLNIRLDSIESRMGKGLTAVYLFSDQIYGTPFDFYQIREVESVVQTHAKIERPISITHPSLP